MRAPEEQIALLQERIRERLDDLRGVPPGDARYAALAGAVLTATADLVEYEQRLPILLDEAPQRLSALVVRWTGVATSVVCAGLTLATIPRWISIGWLAVLVPLLLVGLRMPWLAVHEPGGPHLPQRRGAIAVAASLPLVVVAVTGAAGRWVDALLVILAVLLVVFGVASLIRDVPESSDDEPPTPPSGLALSP